MRKLIRDIGRGFYNLFIAIAVVAFLGGSLAIANYAVTQGSGTNFGSIVISTVHYAQQLICDATTPSQCAAVNSSGQVAIQAPPTLPLPTGAATSANQSTEITSLATIATNTGASVPAGTALIGKVGIDQTTPGTTNGVQVNAALPAGTNSIGTVILGAGTAAIGNLNSQYPATAVPITASATGTTGATTATLTNVTSHTTYICGFSIRANATAAATNNATVTGTITGTLNFTQWTAPLASGLGVTEEVFSPCVPASAVSTSIAVVSGAPGTGGVVSVTAWGYSL